VKAAREAEKVVVVTPCTKTKSDLDCNLVSGQMCKYLNKHFSVLNDQHTLTPNSERFLIPKQEV
jgi:hypothetical protein